jgi:virginiamycin B lyase
MRRRRFLVLTAALPAAAACSGAGSQKPAPTVETATRNAPPSPTASPRAVPSGTSGAESPSTTPPSPATTTAAPVLKEYPVTRGSGPHDVAPAPDGTVWYTGQRNGTLGRLNPADGSVTEVRLNSGSAPHGVIAGPDGAAWVTDGGRDAIVRVDPVTSAIKEFPLPGKPGANLNTAVFDARGRLWFTGQDGYYGVVEPDGGNVRLMKSPRGTGPYGICATPSGAVYYASLAGNHIARVDLESGAATPVDPPTLRQGARRIWSDSKSQLWISEWNAGQVTRYIPSSGQWKSWKLPGSRPQAYAVYVDDHDLVWLTDFTANAIVRFDPATEAFLSFPLPKPGASVRQLLGRHNEVWGAESLGDALVVIRS